MGTFTTQDVRSRGQAAAKRVAKSASFALSEAVAAQKTRASHDIFLSHAFKDAEMILGLKDKLEGYGWSVYVDWIDDPQLDRSQVSPDTARTLRQRMDSCKSLLYAVTPSSGLSKWMPWECGYVDGRNGRSAILPVTDVAAGTYKGQEYLGIYPYIMEYPQTGETANRLWVYQGPGVYVRFDLWLKGQNPRKH